MTGIARSGSPRIALVHDWLTGMRGGERVLEALCRHYPAADVYTLVHVRGTVTAAIEQRRVRQSWVGRLPGVRRYYRACLPLFPIAIEQFALDDYDLVISTSHCAAKSVVVPGRARHLCYCFTPMRYAWDQFDAYFGAGRLGGFSVVMRRLMRRLARWDAATSGRPHRYVSISQYVAARIGRYYNRRSAVVYPPVATDFFRPSGVPPEPFALIVSALVPYKRVDVGIAAARRAGVRLVVVGSGPERARLEQAAGADVEFAGRVDDDGVCDFYNRARVVLLPGEEDFGLVPVEAQACGRPVVALGRGGAVETVVDGTTGVLVPDASPDAFAEGIRRAWTLRPDVSVMRAHVEQFSTGTFLTRMAQQADDLLAAPPGNARW